MKKTTTTIFLLFIIFGTFLWGSGCEKEDHFPDTGYVTVKMINNSSQETHMWTKGETMGASNKMAPGNTRLISVGLKYETAESNPSLFIAAGRNGEVLDLAETEVSEGTAAFYQPWESEVTEPPDDWTGIVIHCKYTGTFEPNGKITLQKSCW